jgi:hypothetical protein
MKVYIGWDSRERKAFNVAEQTARGFGCDVIPLYEDRLRCAGLLTRPVDRRGQMWDLNSNAPQSTEFAIARFFVPLLAHSGWCLFADADVVFMEDPHSLLRLADTSKALLVVKHREFAMTDVVTGTGYKMDGQAQTVYPRKLWSSVILWNCDHPAHRTLNLTLLNQWPGRDLHAFKWLSDDEIGDLPAEANWLVGVQPKPDRPMIAHYTLGTPDMAGHEDSPHSDIWYNVSKR